MVSPMTAAGISDRAISIDVRSTQEEDEGSAVHAAKSVKTARAPPKNRRTDAKTAVMREP
jgi:hypothetical protein